MKIDEKGCDRYICPHCGHPKHLRSFVSGNSCGGRIWSDERKEFPMMHRPSPIQRCNHCNRFFYLDSAVYEYINERELMLKIERKLRDEEQLAGHVITRPPTRQDIQKSMEEALKEAFSNGFGDLNVYELFEAYKDIVNEQTSREQIISYYLNYIWSYNAVSSHDSTLDAHFELCASKLIRILGDSNPLTAELYRELGQFEKAIEICQNVLNESKEPDVVKMIMNKSLNCDSDVFIIDNPQKCPSPNL